MLVSLRAPGASSPRILAVSVSGRWMEPAEEGQVDLGAGWWALPGLVDAHSHLAADTLQLAPADPEGVRRRAYACLDRGTFLVIDKGWSDNVVVATLSELEPTAAPDFEAAGRMIAVADGYYPDFAVETDSEGLVEVVREAAAEGAGWVKLVGDWPRKGIGPLANFSEEELAAAVAVAHSAGVRVAIHTMAPEVPSMAVAAGIDSIEHGLFLTASDLTALAARSGAWVPTILRMETLVDALGPESSGGRLIRRGLANVAELLASAPAELTILAGTDLATGPGEVAREVEALIRAGLDPVRAVRAASDSARSYTGRSPGFRVGELADAVFYEADPWEDPSVLLHPTAVMRAGQLR